MYARRRAFGERAVIRAHAERFHNISILQIDARHLRDDATAPHSHAGIMARSVREFEKIPAAQVGIRSLSAEKRLADLPTKIFWAKDIVEQLD